MARQTTPLDTLWTWIAGAGCAVGSYVFLILAAGVSNPFSPLDNNPEDWLDVNRAYFGALLLSLILGTMGAILWRSASTSPPYALLVFPRFTLLEGSEGNRDPLMAKTVLLAVIIVPLAGLISSLYNYIRKSEVSGWSDWGALPSGFVESRIAALRSGCRSNPCYRLYPDENSFEWFWFSDVGLILAILGAGVTWVGYVGFALKRI